jgi:hypothetical protein
MAMTTTGAQTMSKAFNIKRSDHKWVVVPATPLDWRDSHRTERIRVWQQSKRSFRFEIRHRWRGRIVGRATTFDAVIQAAIRAAG